MNFIIIAVIFFLTNDLNLAKEYHRVTRETAASNEEASASAEEAKRGGEEKKDLEEIMSTEDEEIPNPDVSSQESESRYPFAEESLGLGLNKAYVCSKLQCPDKDKLTPVCACNFVTGKVATFQNKCDSKKHNCRFDTDFKVILNSICPWEFASRRKDKDYIFDYRDPKYYNYVT